MINCLFYTHSGLLCCIGLLVIEDERKQTKRNQDDHKSQDTNAQTCSTMTVAAGDVPACGTFPHCGSQGGRPRARPYASFQEQ